MKVRWSSDAEDDRDAIRAYIAADNPRAALRVDEAFGIAAERLGNFPFSGHVGALPNTRQVLAHDHYRLVYEVRDDAVWIVAVVHTSRQWPPLTEDES
ncbi:type II toxin-antitoxin system RelE/ParE family toxin [Mesorhizobium hunchu]|uniref:type II toxin-antitoxin system RelE/ParE family toxin n=1 Tax=Mesorhizobium hunchu TaxID=3157708 RepID=UPI003CCD72C6